MIRRSLAHWATILFVLLAFRIDIRPIQAQEQQIILDTDIGDDIDDAYAVALITSSPNVRLLGVTTAFGATRERAELAAKLLKVLGKPTVPVYAGRRSDHAIGRQYEWARDFRSSALKHEDAVEFMHSILERSPKMVTLVAIGPLTNLGDLLTKYPAIKSNIKRIVIMGGSVKVGYCNNPNPEPEWNIKCDPAAARIVFTSGVPLVMAGLEVTRMMQFDAERQRKLFAFGTSTTDALAALTNLWGGGTPTLFDPVAVAYALGAHFSDSEPHHVVVDDNGQTRITDGTANVEVLVNPNKDAFLDWYLSALKPKL